MPDVEHLVLGAGCAGLALAAALLDAGVTAPITLVDARTRWEEDRTWCFWDTGDVPWAHLAAKRWSAWRVVTEKAEAVQRASGAPYCHLASATYYAVLLERLEGAPNVELHAGTRVRAVEGSAGARVAAHGPVRVQTTRGELTAARAYDALGGTGPLARPLPAGELRQRFLGQVVRTAEPAFDPMVATLMDFRVGQEDGLHFIYVLPFTTTVALVEDTHIGLVATPAAERRATLAAHLAAAHGVSEVEVEHEERGAIPMTAEAFAREPAPGVWTVGTAAGAVRPSSGYAFARTQRHARAVARAAAAGARTPPPGPGSARAAALDGLFLAALRRRPEAFPALFATLAQRVPGPAFARFMSDAARPGDDLRVVAALPGLPLLAA